MEVSICISSTIITLFVEQIPSVLSTFLFPFSSDFAVVSPVDCKCLSLYLHYSKNLKIRRVMYDTLICITLKIKNTSNDVWSQGKLKRFSVKKPFLRKVR